MIDPVQLVLLIVVVLLAVIMVVLGIQVFFILKELRITAARTNKLLEPEGEIESAMVEFRDTMKRVNRLLDTTEELTDNISQPLSLLSGIVSSTRTISSILGLGKNQNES